MLHEPEVIVNTKSTRLSVNSNFGKLRPISALISSLVSSPITCGQKKIHNISGGCVKRKSITDIVFDGSVFEIIKHILSIYSIKITQQQKYKNTK